MTTTPTLPAYLTPAYLAALVLVEGGGSGAPGDRCAIQEVRAWLGLDPSSDTVPDNVCPVIGAAVYRADHSTRCDRRALAQVLPRLLGSRGSAALTQRRHWAVAHAVIRVSICSRLATIAARSGLVEGRRTEILGWRDHLAAIPEMVDRATCAEAARVTMAIHAAAHAAVVHDVTYDADDKRDGERDDAAIDDALAAIDDALTYVVGPARAVDDVEAYAYAYGLAGLAGLGYAALIDHLLSMGEESAR